MKQSVLVIDDDVGVGTMIRLMLDDEGYRVISVTDARDGLRKLTAERVDLIITDIIMPDMEGIELIVRVRNAHPTVRIVAISGGGRSHNADFLKFAQRLGADAVLAKPFRREDLMEVVRKVLPKA